MASSEKAAKRASKLSGLAVAIGLGVAATAGQGVAAADPSDAGADPSSSSDSTGATDTTPDTKPDTKPDPEPEPDRTPSGPTTDATDDPVEIDIDTDDTDDPKLDASDADEPTTKTTAKPPKKTAPRSLRAAISQAAPPALTAAADPASAPKAPPAKPTAAISNAIAQVSAPVARWVATAVADPTPTVGIANRAVSTTQAAALRAPAAPTPAEAVVREILSIVGFAPGALTPGAPADPLSSLLELAYAAWRRIDYRLFNDSPRATTTELDDQNLQTGVITGTLGVLDGDDQNRLTYTVTEQPEHGEVLLSPDGSFTYTPDTAWAHATGGTDGFTVQVTDEGRWHLHLFDHILDDGHTVTVPVTLTVNRVNTAPTIVIVDEQAGPGGSTRYTLETDDYDDDPVTITGVNAQPDRGTLTKIDDTTFVYTPDPDYAHSLTENGATDPGTDTVKFTADDGNGGTTTLADTVTINGVNAAPTVTIVTRTVDGNGAVTYTLDADDADGDTVVFAGTNAFPSRGNLVKIDDTTFRYTPDQDYAHSLTENGATDPGSDTVKFTGNDGHGKTATVTDDVTIDGVNTDPTVEIASETVNADGSITYTLTLTDADGDDVTTTAGNPPGTRGTLTKIDETTYVWKVNPAYAHGLTEGGATAPGSDTVIFGAFDGHGGSGFTSDTISVQPVNSAPTVRITSIDFGSDGRIIYTLATSDADLDTVTVNGDNDVTRGTLVKINDTTFEYTPNPAYAHSLAVGGATANGSDIITFTADDGHGKTGELTATALIAPVNTAPTFTVGTPTTPHPVTGRTVYSPVVTDADGDQLRFSADPDDAPMGAGQIVDLGNGTFAYIPDHELAHALPVDGSYTDTYTVIGDDGHGGTYRQTVTTTVTFVNSQPIVSSVANTSPDGTSASGRFSAVDADGDVLTRTVAIAAMGSGGTFAVNAETGFFAVTAAAGEPYIVQITYTATDPYGAWASQTFRFENRLAPVGGSD